MRAAMATCRSRTAAHHHRVARGRRARASTATTTRRCAVYSPPTDGIRAPVRLLDPRWRLHVRIGIEHRRAPEPAGSRTSTAWSCRSSTASRPSTRTRRRWTTATPVCCGPLTTPTSWVSTASGSWSRGASAGGGLAAGLALAGPRPRRGEPDVPAPDLPHDRRPQRHVVEPHRGRTGLESRAPIDLGWSAYLGYEPGRPTTSRSTRPPPAPRRRRPAAGLDRSRRRSTCSATRTSRTRSACSPRASRRAARLPGRAPRLRDDCADDSAVAHREPSAT